MKRYSVQDFTKFILWSQGLFDLVATAFKKIQPVA